MGIFSNMQDTVSAPSAYGTAKPGYIANKVSGVADKVKSPWQTMTNEVNGWYARPERMPTLDANGNLLPQFQVDATSARPMSAWYNLQAKQQGMLDNRLRDQAMRDSLNSRTSAWNMLASNGGLDSGARERIARNAMQDQRNSFADIYQQSALNMNNLQTQDWLNQINADQWNISNALGEVNNKFTAEDSAWKTLMQQKMAGQFADAIGRMGDGGRGGGGLGSWLPSLNPQDHIDRLGAMASGNGSAWGSFYNDMDPLNPYNVSKKFRF